MGRCQTSEVLPLLLSETTGWVGWYGITGGRARCWNPNGGRFGAKSLGWVEWVMGHEVAVEQVWCPREQLVVAVGCVCKSKAGE